MKQFSHYAELAIFSYRYEIIPSLMQTICLP